MYLTGTPAYAAAASMDIYSDLALTYGYLQCFCYRVQPVENRRGCLYGFSQGQIPCRNAFSLYESVIPLQCEGERGVISAIQLGGDALLIGLALLVERELVAVRLNAVGVVKDDDRSFLLASGLTAGTLALRTALGRHAAAAGIAEQDGCAGHTDLMHLVSEFADLPLRSITHAQGEEVP